MIAAGSTDRIAVVPKKKRVEICFPLRSQRGMASAIAKANEMVTQTNAYTTMVGLSEPVIDQSAAALR